MRYQIALIAFSCLLAAQPAIADDTHESYNDIVEHAFRSMGRDFKTEWSFTETKNDDDALLVGRYDPRRPGGKLWALVSVDGREPTDDEREAYENEKNDVEPVRITADEEEQKDNDAAMVNFDTLELVEETSEYWLFSFVPREEDADDEEAAFMQHIDGTLKIVKDGHYVAHIDLRSEKPFKPATGVKINHFRTRLEFAPAASGGPIVPQSVDVAVKGRAMLLIKFDESESIRYSDYEYAGSPGL